MNVIGSNPGRRRRLRVTACGCLAAAGLIAGVSSAHAATPTSYIVGGKVTSNDFAQAKSIAVRASTTNKAAKALRGKIVVVQVGVLTKFRTRRAAPSRRGTSGSGTGVSITWKAKAGTHGARGERGRAASRRRAEALMAPGRRPAAGRRGVHGRSPPRARGVGRPLRRGCPARSWRCSA